MQGTAWAANASLTSLSAMSRAVTPARASALWVAGIGPRPMYDTSTPAAADDT